MEGTSKSKHIYGKKTTAAVTKKKVNRSGPAPPVLFRQRVVRKAKEKEEEDEEEKEEEEEEEERNRRTKELKDMIERLSDGAAASASVQRRFGFFISCPFSCGVSVCVCVPFLVVLLYFVS